MGLFSMFLVGASARRHRPEGAQAFQPVAQIVVLVWEGRKLMIFQ
jgi:hypothetical protein